MQAHLLAGLEPHPELLMLCWSFRRKSSDISLLFTASPPSSGPASWICGVEGETLWVPCSGPLTYQPRRYSRGM